MGSKNFVFSFVAKGLDTMITGIGKATNKTKDAAKELTKVKTTFAEIYRTQRTEGKNVFAAFTTSIRQTTIQTGGLLKALTMISRVGAGGILLFFASKAFQQNLGGIATAFARLQGAFGEFWGKFNMMINEIMRAMTPMLETLVTLTTNILVDLLQMLTWVVEAIRDAPKPIQVLIGVLVGLGLVLWGLSTNPVFIVLAAAVVTIWGIYRGIKAIVDLIKGNQDLSMNVGFNAGGREYQVMGNQGGGTRTDNTVNNVQNSVYLQGTGSGVGDAKAVSNELSILNSILKTE